MASAAGLEPTTHSLGNCCSILMSYADTWSFYNVNLLKMQAYFEPARLKKLLTR